MSEQGLLDGFEVECEVECEPDEHDEQVDWLEAAASRVVYGGGVRQFFLEGYQALRAAHVPWREALCIAWLSLGRDDRGGLDTVGALCKHLGVSRMWYYKHKAGRDNEPARRLNAWEWWAERLQLARLRGSRLAEVDEATYQKAVSLEGKAADRELYYKRARVLVNLSEIAATIGQKVNVEELSDDELDALLAKERDTVDELEDRVDE